MSASLAMATILRFETDAGDIDVRLYDTATPASVANFLNYVRDDDLDLSIFHRMPRTPDDYGNVGTFVLQGGGYKLSQSGIVEVPTDPPVVNEPLFSNLKYTLSYAKLGGDPNSATSGFFFNTQDNANNLDSQNGGFTVFGTIVRGFGALDLLATLPTLNHALSDSLPYIPGENEQKSFVLLYDVYELDLPAGDYNFDGIVDLGDYTVWRSALGSTRDVAADGDGSGRVDMADYAIWKSGFGESSSAALSAATASVPEPATLGLILASAVALAVWRRRRR